MLSFFTGSRGPHGPDLPSPFGRKFQISFCKKKNPNKKKRGCCYCWRLYCQRAERLANVQNQECQAFSGATCSDMEHHINPIIAKKPNHVILHCGTNDLMDSNPEDIAEKIKDLAIKVTKNKINCTVSSLIMRMDRDLNEKILLTKGQRPLPPLTQNGQWPFLFQPLPPPQNGHSEVGKFSNIRRRSREYRPGTMSVCDCRWFPS